VIRAIDRVNRGPGQKIMYRCEGATGSLVGFLTPHPGFATPPPPPFEQPRSGQERGEGPREGGEVEKP